MMNFYSFIHWIKQIQKQNIGYQSKAWWLKWFRC